MYATWCVEIYNIARPLKRALTAKNISRFYDLSKSRHNGFYLWLQNNFYRMQYLIMHHDAKLNVLQSYFESDIYHIIANADYFDLAKKQQASYPVYDRHSMIQVGGSDVITFLWCIVFFLFDFYLIDLQNLSYTINEFDMLGGQPEAKLSYFLNANSETKQKKRLVFCVEYQMSRFALKIARNTDEFLNEFNIYQQLMSLQSPNIVRICNSDPELKIMNNNLILNADGTEFRISDVDELGLEAIESNLKICILTHYDPEYATLSKIMPKLTFEEKIFFLQKVTKFLYKLNRDIGLIHWDLHTGNILVHVQNYTQFKIYDFDLSSTKLYQNHSLFKKSTQNILKKNFIKNNDSKDENWIENINYSELEFIGLSYDFLRLSTLLLYESEDKFPSLTPGTSLPMAMFFKIIKTIIHKVKDLLTEKKLDDIFLPMMLTAILREIVFNVDKSNTITDILDMVNNLYKTDDWVMEMQQLNNEHTGGDKFRHKAKKYIAKYRRLLLAV